MIFHSCRHARNAGTNKIVMKTRSARLLKMRASLCELFFHSNLQIVRSLCSVSAIVRGFTLFAAFAAAFSRFLRHIHPDTDMIMLGEPNNPTGLCTDRTVLTEIADYCEARGIRLVLDECFMDFVEDSEGRSWIHRWSSLSEEIHYRNVCVLRAFTKFYGMAGLRLGWCVIPDLDFLRKVQLAGPPWAVSCAAQAAGIAVLKEHGYREELRALVARERPRLAEGLERLGFFVLPGEANFLAFYVPAGLYPGNTDLTKKRAADSMRKKQINLDELLRSYGIMIRDLRSFRGLGSGWYRTAVRTKEENERLLNALSEIFEVNL